MIILLHSSKTMRSAPSGQPLRPPRLLKKARGLDAYLKTLSVKQLAKIMHISPLLAERTHELIAAWNDDPEQQTPAIDSFIGDIYSGLQAEELSPAEREYADKTLRIVSGLYGVLRPLDGICPYRLEMGYTFPKSSFVNLYEYWGKSIAACLPKTGIIVNVSSLEYMKAILPYIDADRMIAPQFLTTSPETGKPIFMAVHAKIARGAFARWLITTKITNPAKFTAFADLGYEYDAALSTDELPTFVCKTFGGKGLSIRLR